MSTKTEVEQLREQLTQRWAEIVSDANWKKGQIIAQWPKIEGDMPLATVDDEGFARAVGGVTTPHIGRLRRVHNRFFDCYSDYPHLLWSHFLAALDWYDADRWLSLANDNHWTVAEMRRFRWEQVF